MSPETNPSEIPEKEPLNRKQIAFAERLGIAWAEGKRNFEDIYEEVGYKRHRGNSARLASDPRVIEIAQRACAEANRLNGLYIGYLQAKALSMLEANALVIHQTIATLRKSPDITPEQQAHLEAVTWPLSKFKIDKDGVISVELPDKKGVIEMLAKMLGNMPDETAEAITGLGDRLDRALSRTSQAA